MSSTERGTDSLTVTKTQHGIHNIHKKPLNEEGLTVLSTRLLRNNYYNITVLMHQIKSQVKMKTFDVVFDARHDQSC